eukprot:c17889_g2_i1.p1 GENE.c17889_g2_i1~~c17889_g2_i1.p1  ORF type:complete len:1187 (+),score=292.97 c17889_g2_i1:166-3561(+)
MTVLRPEAVFLSRKAKHDYESYSVDGILKENWLKKHKLRLPSVVVLLFEMNENMPALREGVVDAVDKLRASFNGHACKIVVCLVSKTNIDQGFADKSAEAVRKALDPDSKTVMPVYAQRLAESIDKLSKILLETAHGFYKDGARRVKRVREKVNKLTQPHLLLRHSFKIGYFAEFRSDSVTALKYYVQAYALIDELLRLPQLTILEIKHVADILNFRICVLNIQTMHHIEAVDQFEKHMSIFRDREGPSDLKFLHHQWLGRQFHFMGEMLERNPCVIVGTLARRNLQCAYYYSIAGNHFKQFRYLIIRTHKAVASHVPTVPSLDPTQFLGQYPNIPESDLVYHVTNRFVTTYDLLSKPLSLFNLAWAHYSYKGENRPNTTLQRQSLAIAYQIAQENLYLGDFVAAERLLTTAAESLRKEHWNTLLAAALRQCRQCSYKLKHAEDFVTYSLEICSAQLGLSVSEQRDVLNQILTVVAQLEAGSPPLEHLTGLDIDSGLLVVCAESRSSPEMEVPRLVQHQQQQQSNNNNSNNASHEHRASHSDARTNILNESLTGGAATAWKQSKVCRAIDRDHPFCGCRVRFSKQEFLIDEPVTLKIFIKLHAPCWVEFNQLHVCFNHPKYNMTITHTSDPLTLNHFKHRGDDPESARVESNLRLIPDQESVFSFEFISNIPLTLACQSVLLCYASPEQVAKTGRSQITSHGLVLGWLGSEYSRSHSWVQLDTQGAIKDEWTTAASSRIEIIETTIRAPEPNVRLSILHDPPALVDSPYPLTFTIVTNSDSLSEPVVRAEFEEFPSLVIYALINGTFAQLPDTGLQLQNIPHSTEHSITFWLVSNVSHERPITLKLEYRNELGISQCIPLALTLPFTHALAVNAKFETDYVQSVMGPKSRAQDQPVSANLTVRRPAMLHVTADADTPHPLRLINCKLILHPEERAQPPKILSSPEFIVDASAATSVLCLGDRHSFAFALEPQTQSTSTVFGRVELTYERSLHKPVQLANENGTLEECKSLPAYVQALTTVTLPLPSVACVPQLVSVVLNCPANTIILEPFDLIMKITNHTSQLHMATLTIADSPLFVVSGFKQFRVQVWFVLAFLPCLVGCSCLPAHKQQQHQTNALFCGCWFGLVVRFSQ